MEVRQENGGGRAGTKTREEAGQRTPPQKGMSSPIKVGPDGIVTRPDNSKSIESGHGSTGVVLGARAARGELKGQISAHAPDGDGRAGQVGAMVSRL